MKARTRLLSVLAAAALLGLSPAIAAPADPVPESPTGPAATPKPRQTPKEGAAALLDKARTAPVQVPEAPRAAAAGANSVNGATAAHALEASDLAAWLDGRVPYALKSGEIAGMVISVVKDGKLLLQKGYGLADVEAKVAMDPATTLVRPGSTAKLFTWTAVMQLVEQGKIDLDRNVNDYLDFRIEEAYGAPVTMRHLMNHRAGFEEGLKDVLGYDPATAQSTERYLKEHPRPMLFAPGEAPAYSNYGVALAGYIVQRVSGEPFETYLERHIFGPLGMRHSTFVQPLPKGFPGFLSKGYNTPAEPPSPFEMVITAPAGALTTTAADMSRFMLAHLQNGSLDGVQLLKPETVARMHSRSAPAMPGFAAMAHGFFHSRHNGRTMIGHGGDTVVYHSDLNLLLDEGVGIYFTYNSRGKDSAVYGARKELMDGFMDRYFPAPAEAAQPTLATAVADAQRIAGRYQSSRRVDHGFLRFFYLLLQTVITANPDGTISMPDDLGQMGTYRAIGPQLWRKVGGAQMLALSEVNGVKTVTDSENPVSVLQESSVVFSAPLNMSVLVFSFVVLLCALAAWPLGALLRRADGAASPARPELRRLRTVQRGAVLVALVYVTAWFLLIQPVLGSQVGAYHSGIDWIVGSLELSGLLVIGAALAGVWVAWRMRRAGAIGATGLTRIWAVLVALALLGVVWLGIVGQLITWNLNY